MQVGYSVTEIQTIIITLSVTGILNTKPATLKRNNIEDEDFLGTFTRHQCRVLFNNKTGQSFYQTTWIAQLNPTENLTIETINKGEITHLMIQQML